jgi:cytochrome b561
MWDEQSAKRYNGVAKFFHWLTVGLVVAQFAIAWTMPEVRRETVRAGLIMWHISLGTTILAVTIARAVWRLSHRAPPPPSSLPISLQITSRAIHVLLYVLLLALPLLGWVNASARGWPVTLFGIMPLPPLSAVGSMLGLAFGAVHQALAIMLLTVIAMHLLGALYHLVVLRDRTVQRML